MTRAIDIFEQTAGDYEERQRRMVPDFDAFYGTAVDALELAGRPVHRVLDLGAGTGLLSRMVLTRRGEVQLTLLDGAPAMLDQARAALGETARYITADMTEPLPAGPWDAVVSALAIHHVDDDAKQQLFRAVHAELGPGGVFVNAEQVGGPTALFHDHYAAWHEAGARTAGASSQEWHDAHHGMRLDRWATVEHHLEWLRAAGFADVDCLYKNHRFAVIVARRSG